METRTTAEAVDETVQWRGHPSRRLFWLAIGTLLGGCAAGGGEAFPASTEEKEVSSPTLCLHLGASRQQVPMGEPFLLAVGLENCSESPVSVRRLLAPEYGLLTISAISPDGRERTYYPGVRRDGRGARSIDLRPGGSWYEPVQIYYDRNGWFPRDVGRWQFRAAYSSAHGSIESHTVVVDVEAVESKIERAAAEAFMEDTVARAFYLGGSKGADLAFQDLVERYPGSSCAAYARLGLAWSGSAPVPSIAQLLDSVLDPGIAALAEGRFDSSQRERDERGSVARRLAAQAGSPEVSHWIRQLLSEGSR